MAWMKAGLKAEWWDIPISEGETNIIIYIIYIKYYSLKIYKTKLLVVTFSWQNTVPRTCTQSQSTIGM